MTAPLLVSVKYLLSPYAAKLSGLLLIPYSSILANCVPNTAVEVENLSIQLKFLTGSAEEGSKAFDTLTKFAGTVPFELQQIANAAPNLLTVVDGADEVHKMVLARHYAEQGNDYWQWG
jgi:hypothetical protein